MPPPPGVNLGPKILVLGGTGAARLIADKVAAQNFHVVYSLAGVSSRPELPAAPGVEVRTGGFGGVPGLMNSLREGNFLAVVDATHPFAESISANARIAAAAAGVTLLRYERPAWRPEQGDNWLSCATSAQAALALPPSARAFVTIGRKQVAPFLQRNDISGVLRMIEPPAELLPPNWTVYLARPPFSFDDERKVLQQVVATHIVSKNSGGTEGRTKLDAARDLGLEVIMIERPPKAGGIAVTDVSHFDDLPKLFR